MFSTVDFHKAMQVWYQQCLDHDAKQNDRLNRWRNLETESAQFIGQLIQIGQINHVLEIGTSNGYSTAWLAYFIKNFNGKLDTVEIDAKRSALAEAKLKEFKLNEYVKFHIDDAKVFLEHALADYQLIFLDAERVYYMDYVADLKRLLASKLGTTLVVDNVVSHAAEVEDFIKIFTTDASYITSVLPIGAGLFICTYAG